MSGKILAQHDGPTDQVRHWDQPQGLGWQLWRRTHATGLLTTQIQRDVARLRAHIPLHHVSLAAEIQRRWGLGQDSIAHRYHPDLPFFFARFPFFYLSAPHEQLSSMQRSPREFVDAPSVSSLFGRSRSSRGFGRPTAMTTEHAVQRSSVVAIALPQHGRAMPTLEQMPRQSPHSQGSRSFSAAAVTSTYNSAGASSLSKSLTEVNTQDSYQPVVQRSALVSDAFKTRSDVRTFAPTVSMAKLQRSGQDSPFVRHQHTLVFRSPMSQGRVEHNVPALSLSRRISMWSAATAQHSQPMLRSLHWSEREGTEINAGVGSGLSRPQYWLAPRFTLLARGDEPGVRTATFPKVAGGSIYRQARAVEQRGISVPYSPLAQARTREYGVGIGPSLPVLLTNPVTTTEEVTRHRTVLSEPLTGGANTAHFVFPLLRPVAISFSQGTALLHRQSDRKETGPHGDDVMMGMFRRAPASGLAAEVSVDRQAGGVEQRGTSVPRIPFARARGYEGGGLFSTPVLQMNPVAATEEAIRSRQALGQHLAAASSPLHTVFLASRQIAVNTMSVGMGETQVHRQSDRRGNRFRGDDIAIPVGGQAPAFGLGTEIIVRRQVGAIAPHVMSAQYAPFAQIRAYEGGLPFSTPILRMNPIAATKEMTHSRKTILPYQVEAPSATRAVFSVLRPIAMSVSQGTALLHRQSDRKATGLHGDDVMISVFRRVPATGLVSVIGPVDRQVHHRETGAHRAGYNIGVVTGQGWVPPFVVSTDQNGFALRRMASSSSTALRQWYSHASAGAGKGADNSRVPIGIPSLMQLHYDREARLHRSDDRAKPVMDYRLATGHVSSINEVETRIPAATISRPPTLGLHSVQRSVVIRGRLGGTDVSSGSVEEPGISRSFRREDLGATESKSDREVVYRRLGLTPASSRIGGFDEDHDSFQRFVGSLGTPLAAAPWGERRAPMVDHRLSTSSALRMIQFKETKHPIWFQAAPAEEDSWSDQRAADPSSTLTKAWPLTLALPSLVHGFHSWTDRGERASPVVMRDTVHDMPLAPPLRTETQSSSLSQQRISGPIVQTSSELLSPMTVGPALTTPIGNENTSPGRATITAASQAPIDLDELVEKAWQKLMLKLTIEQERRGHRRWL